MMVLKQSKLIVMVQAANLLLSSVNQSKLRFKAMTIKTTATTMMIMMMMEVMMMLKLVIVVVAIMIRRWRR